MPTSTSTGREQGFEVLTLRNGSLELTAVPELGAKIISLKNLRTGREWMYRPPGGLRLFRNRPGDDFAASTLVGWDECLPTIAPCAWDARTLPDHGEAWSVAWDVDRAAWQQCMLSTSVGLSISPLVFRRTLALAGREIRVDYGLTNRSEQSQAFLWAMHPLLAIQPGDRLDLPAEVRGQLAAETWVDALDLGGRTPACAKVFAGPLRAGRAGVVNPARGDGLAFAWDAGENPLLGVWLTRGGWNGHHHLALEPTNGMPDSLADAVEKNHSAWIPPRATRSWSVRLCLEP
jgi:galactose mutarotase-like enzyme